MTVTYLESDTHYEHILHVSDVHIRTGDPSRARYTEYSIVFKNFIDQLNDMDLSQTLTVVTGDVFHHKGKIEPAGIQLTHEFFTQVLNKTPVVVICGNHDYRQDDVMIPDMIETLLTVYKCRYPLYYLNQTGHYVLGNLGFGLVDIRDTLKHYNTRGRYEDLPKFPSPLEFPSSVEYSMALFHGSVASKEVYERYACFQGYPLEWFQGYSRVLLGDIHKKQIHVTREQTWAYPGSLIQQDFGESWNHHGFLTWDLKKNLVNFRPVYNPYGLCTLKLNEDWLVHLCKKEWVSVKEICQDPLFPKTPMVRVVNQSLKDCQSFLEGLAIYPTRLYQWMVEEETHESKPVEYTHALEELNTPLKWLDYLKERTQNDCSQFLFHPETLKLKEGYESYRKFHERNEKIQKMIDAYQRYQTEMIPNNHRVELVHLSWSYLMCYGENNHFEFKGLANQIALLNGKNAMGKSSFLDILCIALYGEATKMRHLVSGKKYTDKIIHDQRPSHKMAPHVKLLVSIQGCMYEIRRVFGVQSAKHKEHSIMTKEVMVSKIENTQKMILAEGNTLVDRWIETHIGTMESVLMSTMICQMDLNNFFHLKQDDQKSILDTALRLENVSLYGKIIKESLLAHLDVQSHVKQLYESLPVVNVSEKNVEECHSMYVKAQSNYEKRCLQKEHWLTKINDPQWKTREVMDSIEEDYRCIKDQWDHRIVKGTEDVGLEERIAESIRSEERIMEHVRLNERIEFLNRSLESYSEVVIYKDSQKHLDKWLKKQDAFLKMKPNVEVTSEWITEMETVYAQWWGLTFQGMSMEELEKQRQVYFNSVIPKPLSECPTLNGTFDEAEYKLLLDSPKVYREMDTSLVKDWTDKDKDKTLKQWLKLQTAMESQRMFEEAYKELESYNEFTFNPRCKACQANPMKLKKSALEKVCKESQSVVKKQKLGTCLEVMEDMANECKQLLDLYEVRRTNEAYIIWKERVDTLEWIRYKDWKDRYDAFVQTYEEHQRYWREKQEWDSILTRVTEQKKQMELYEVWIQEKTIVEQKVEQFQRSLDKQQWMMEHQEIMERYNEINEQMEEWKSMKQLQDAYRETESLYAIYQVRTIDKQLKQEKEQMDALYEDYRLALQEKEMENLYLEKKLKYQSWLDELEKRIQGIQELEMYFIGDKHGSDGYKEWIYKEKVIPMLNKEMNAFLSGFEAFRFKMIYDKKQFIYMLEDRGNEPTLDKASGYQNFIISLAFRLALTRIGAIGQQLKHLFIDEGFTACDASNIEKVPLLLKSILNYGQYHSILLMSHLDSVRECTRTMISIDREDPFSYIRYGEVYPTFLEYKKMKKGS